MAICNLIVLLILSNLWLLSCDLSEKRSRPIRKLHRTGELIAVDDLIQKYEREHQKMYGEEVINGDCLSWPDLDTKILSDYCKKYLQHILPSRYFNGATGIKIKKTLHYLQDYTRMTSEVVIVQCKTAQKSHVNSYYMTRAHNSACVYALKSTGSRSKFILSIINKHCDFQNKPIDSLHLIRKSMEIIGGRHKYTGQPIAKEKYLREFEFEHQELLKQKGHHNVNRIDWLYAKIHPNLDDYCFQYMKVCVPRRYREGMKGSWQIQKLRYRKLNTNDDDTLVTTIICTKKATTYLHYYVTRALEINCVYALIRHGSVRTPFMIINKHCDFEVRNNEKITPEKYDVFHMDVIPKNEVKEERFDILETLNLFP